MLIDKETPGNSPQPSTEQKPWCQCNHSGTCIGCLIRKLVREHYGSEGEQYLIEFTGETALTDMGNKPSLAIGGTSPALVMGNMNQSMNMQMP